jgi:hypothetical protein
MLFYFIKYFIDYIEIKDLIKLLKPIKKIFEDYYPMKIIN